MADLSHFLASAPVAFFQRALAETLRGAVGNLVDNCRMVHPAGGSGAGKFARLLQIATGVDLDDIDVASFREAQVDSAVIAHPQGTVRVKGDFLQSGP